MLNGDESLGSGPRFFDDGGGLSGWLIKHYDLTLGY